MSSIKYFKCLSIDNRCWKIVVEVVRIWLSYLMIGSKYSASVMESVEWKVLFRHICCLPETLHKDHIEPCEHRRTVYLFIISKEIHWTMFATNLNEQIGHTNDFSHGVAQILGWITQQLTGTGKSGAIGQWRDSERKREWLRCHPELDGRVENKQITEEWNNERGLVISTCQWGISWII